MGQRVVPGLAPSRRGLCDRTASRSVSFTTIINNIMTTTTPRITAVLSHLYRAVKKQAKDRTRFINLYCVLRSSQKLAKLEVCLLSTVVQL